MSAERRSQFPPEKTQPSRKESLKERPFVQGVTVDSESTHAHGATRKRDDAFWVAKTDTGYTVNVTVTDLSDVVAKNSPLDKRAFRAGRSRPMFPDEVVDKDMTLKSGQVRPTVSIAVELNNDFVPVTSEVKLTRLQLERANKLTHRDVSKILENPHHSMFDFFSDADHVAKNLRERRQATSSLGPISEYQSGSMMVEEFILLANKAVVNEFAAHNMHGIFTFKKDGQSPVYTPLFQEGYRIKATAPMRKYEALINQRILVAKMKGEAPPYTMQQLNDICRVLNENTLSAEKMRIVYEGERIPVQIPKKVTEKAKLEEQRRRKNAGEPPEMRTIFRIRRNVLPNMGEV